MAHPIIEAQDALKTLLAARPAFAEVDIRDGGPTEREDIHASAFWFNDAIVPRDGWASLGAGRRRIQFQLGFTIAVRTYGDDERSTRAQALDLFEDLAAVLKANPQLDIPDVIRQVDNVTGAFGSDPVSPTEWGAAFTGLIDVTSRDY